MTSFRTSLIVWSLVALLIFTHGQVSEAREIRVKILQEKSGRLYFSAGKEEDIWPGCRWVVYRGSADTIQPLAEGKIAESYEGVSISDSMANLPAQLMAPSVAKIEAADRASRCAVGISSIDAVAHACIGGRPRTFETASLRNERFPAAETGSTYATQPGLVILLSTPEFHDDLQLLLGCSSAIFPTSFQNPIDINPWPVDTIDFQISYSVNCAIGNERGVLPAPHFVALIPNISRAINRNAILTTALRYRIDTSRINNAFEFESVPQLSFLTGSHSYSAYTSDISKAKKLLRENKTAGASVSIDTYSPTLQSTSKFIRGTLTQAGYTTSTVGWNEPADLRLAILPIYSDSPWVALSEVLTSIAKDTIAKDRANQPVRLADQLLKDALATSDSARRMQLLERVDRMLMEDIGAFPLFRPIIHVCAKEEIRGIRFDKDGRLDLRSIYRLKLPVDSSEVKP